MKNGNNAGQPIMLAEALRNMPYRQAKAILLGYVKRELTPEQARELGHEINSIAWAKDRTKRYTWQPDDLKEVEWWLSTQY